MDDTQVRFCTHIKGKGSWFLPFDKGYSDGAGNPPNPAGLATDTFAIIIDEAHSSQGGRTSAKMNMALSPKENSVVYSNPSDDMRMAAEPKAEYVTSSEAS